MNRVSGVLKLHYRDKWSWIYIPALILFSSFTVNLIISFLIPNQDMYTGGVSSVFIFIFVAGILVVAQTFPFALGISIRRTDYFIGSAAVGTIVSIVFGSLTFLMALLEVQSNGWGTRLHFFHLPYVNDGTALEQLSIYIILFLYMFSLGFLISSFARRFGKKGMFISSMVFLLAGSIAILLLHQYEAWGDIFNWFASQTAAQLAYWLIPFVLINLLASYLFLRRATV